MNHPPAARQLARLALKMLKASSDARTATQVRSFFKPEEKIGLYGVNTPKVREIERHLFNRVRATWTLKEAVAFCDILIRNRHLEAKTTGMLLLSRYRRVFDEGLWEKARTWLSGNHCGNWGSTDALSTLILGPLTGRFPHLVPGLKRWTTSNNLWVCRAAAVSLTLRARKGEHLDAAYEVSEALFGDPEDLIQKAAGWLLREAGRTDPGRLESFLLANGPRVPRPTLRYAIERFERDKRKSILAQTKSPVRKGTGTASPEPNQKL